MTTIRPAVAADLDDIVLMGLRFRQDYARHLTRNEARIRQTAEMLLQPPHYLLVAEDADVLIGMLGAAVFDHFVSGDRVASELFWWVEYGFRQTRVGAALLDQAEREARARGCTTFTMATLVDATPMQQAYTARGYVPRDCTYEKDLTCDSISAPTT